jgi:hypothetical protein
MSLFTIALIGFAAAIVTGMLFGWALQTFGNNRPNSEGEKLQL